MNITSLKYDLVAKLSANLNKDLRYHRVEHTLDVFEACSRLALLEGLNAQETTILLTAALLHDSGFLKTYENHEQSSVNLAQMMLPDYDYTPDEIESVVNLINATRMPTEAKTHLAQILCDADLDYLGRTDFFEIAGYLRKEWEDCCNRFYSDKEWNMLQKQFLGNHAYYTASARKLRDIQKGINLERL